jgi:cytoskeletal protein CcmA (bactofilin family)
MLWKKTGKRAVKTSDLTAFIDEGSEIEGKYTFSGTVMLNGKFRGEIATTDTLIIGEKGIVHADVHAGVALISGQLVGNLMATERVELRGSARVFGDVEAPVVVVEEGVLFEGHCRMTNAPPGAENAQPSQAFPMPSQQPQRDHSVISLKR